MWHPEVAPEILLGIPAALVADDHDGLAVQPGPSSHDGSVLAERAIAVQLDEVREDQPVVVIGERALVRSRDLHALQGGEVPVDLLAQLGELALQRRDLLGNVQLAVPGEPFQLVDLLLELQNRFFEVQGGRGQTN